MAISNGVIFIWTGTNASIPSGWTRVTDLDSRYPKATLNTSTNPNVTGGATTHTHTSPSHTHTAQNHTHTFTTNAGSGGGQSTGTSTNSARQDHAHPNVTTGNNTNQSIGSATVTYGSVSNDPLYYEVIYITPSSVTGGIPNLAIGLYEDSDFVSSNTGKFAGYYFCDGGNSTPDLRNRYLKGATAGGNAGGTGGSVTNIHNIDHSHTQSHNHANVDILATTSTSLRGDVDTPTDLVSNTHIHIGTINTNSDTVTTSGLSLTTAETVEPAFKKITALQNRSSTVYTPVGLIGLWLGTIANIPKNFEIISTYNDKHLKMSFAHSETTSGTTGGANTHSHASQAHGHTLSHTHTASVNGHTNSLNNGQSPTPIQTGATSGTTHTASTSSSSLVFDNANTTADSSSNEPQFRTVALIKYKGEKGGAFLFNML